MPKAITIEPIDGKPGKPGQVYYPFVLSPDSLIARIINLPSWPTNIFINLRDMTVLESFQGYQPCSGNVCPDMVYSHMTQWLNAIP